MKKEYLTKDKYEGLLQELARLKFDKRREVAERLVYAKSLGDLAENAEYHAAREEQLEIEERISQLENLLKISEIISSHQRQFVEIGSRVKVAREGGANTEFTIVGSEEADVKEGKISYQSPLGSGLLGKKKGESVTIDTPKGEVKYKIVAIQ